MKFFLYDKLNTYFTIRQQTKYSFFPVCVDKQLYKLYKYFYKKQFGCLLSDERKIYLKKVKDSLDISSIVSVNETMIDIFSQKKKLFFYRLKKLFFNRRKKRQKIKLFCLYHYNDGFPLFRSDVYEPLQTGCESMDFRFDCLGDHHGDNISVKNEYYAELTGHYWVWKNWLPKNKSYDYVGFVHHYRHFDFLGNPKEKCPFDALDVASFEKMFAKYNSENLYLDGADVYVPNEIELGMSCYEQYCAYHPREYYEKFENIMIKKYPQYAPYLRVLRQREQGCFCNMFIMRPRLMEKYQAWLFDILFELEKCVDYASKEVAWLSLKRFPAFMSERFFNVWLCYQMEQKGIVVQALNTYKLTK